MRGSRCNLGCDAVVSLDGAHAFTCPRGGKSQWRHDSIANTLILCAKSAGVGARPATVADEDSRDHNQSKPDVVLTGILSQQPVNIDVSAVRVEHANVAADVRSRVQLKMRRHREPAHRVGHAFAPFVITGLGGLEQEHALPLLKDLAKRAAAHGIDAWVTRQFVPHWLARFSIVAQRLAGNSLRRHMAAPSQHVSGIGGTTSAADGGFDAYIRAAGAAAAAKKAF